MSRKRSNWLFLSKVTIYVKTVVLTKNVKFECFRERVPIRCSNIFFYSLRQTLGAIYHHSTIILKIWPYMADFQFSGRAWVGYKFSKSLFFFFITGIGAYLNNFGKWSEKKGRWSALIYKQVLRKYLRGLSIILTYPP